MQLKPDENSQNTAKVAKNNKDDKINCKIAKILPAPNKVSQKEKQNKQL